MTHGKQHGRVYELSGELEQLRCADRAHRAVNHPQSLQRPLPPAVTDSLPVEFAEVGDPAVVHCEHRGFPRI